MANQNNWTLSSCCCGCSLRTGTLIIAILSLIFSLVGLGFGIFAGVSGLTEGWLDVGIDVVNIILAAVLIHGIRTERRPLVLVWVWATIVTVILTVALGIFIILLTSSLTAAVILFIFAAIQSYFILVVRSYAISLETPELPVSR
ncbi:uncharacterized protein LOC135199865 isoform X2 [Macrobrachium nipponense]|uniref:uncharacterized protein LOC135199865 isoform X2 n=1 Tax=Macrobrachium nipponense TaxID=159736 RepID=UPI0030C8959F